MADSNRILVVDDELHARAICADFLEEAGYEVEVASNGVEALEVLKEGNITILLSDIQMPEMDGITLLKEARKLYPDLEVILMTAYGGLQSAIEAIRSGAYDYLTKPLSREFLLNTIRRCLEKIDLQTRLRESQTKLLEHEKLATLGAVSSWLSHRMRNSLSVIMMCAHYLKGKVSENDSSDYREVIDAIIDKSKIIEKTSKDLISYSKPYELQKSEGTLNGALEDIVESLKAQMQIQKVKLVMELDPNLPHFSCDPHILHEAFENLIVNALQAIGAQENQTLIVKTELLPQGEVQFTLKKIRSQNNIAVTISNSGSIIFPEDLDKIFAPFYTTKENGSGLGLPIVKKIVEQHSGELTVYSRMENGTEWTSFVMIFPILPVEQAG